MNLFWKKFLGRIVSTEKYEQQLNHEELSTTRYLSIEQSETLKEYKRLEEIVQSAAFQDKKVLLQKKKYKDTEEYKLIDKFSKLHNDKSLQLYFKVIDSPELKKYLNYKASPEFLDMLNDKKSEEYKYIKSYEKSKPFKTYARYHDSYVIKEYEKLKDQISSTEFTNANEFWKNKNRWTESEEYATEQKYLQLKSNEDIAFYLKQNADDINKNKGRKVTFIDKFSGTQLDKSKWSSGFYYTSPLIGDFSYTNELQANNSGRNTFVGNGTLQVKTKIEKITSRTWDPAKGFTEKEFNFTSDVLQTGEHFAQKEGIFQVKMRATGNPHHIFWLGSQKRLPHIQLAHIHNGKLSMGMITKDGKKENMTFTGINPAEYYIYTLIWNEKELIWKINNMEVFRITNNIPANEMYMGLNSFIPENEKGGEGLLEVDWVKTLQLPKGSA